MAPPPRRTIPADAASTLYELLPSQLGKDILLSLQTGGWELPQNQPRIPAAREPVGVPSDVDWSPLLMKYIASFVIFAKYYFKCAGG